MNHGFGHNGSMANKKKLIKKPERIDLGAEHQSSAPIQLDLDQKSFEIFMELYQNNKDRGEDVHYTESEFLNLLMFKFIKPSGQRINSDALSKENYEFLQSMMHRRNLIARRIKHAIKTFKKDEFLRIPSQTIKFEILLAVYHNKDINPSYTKSLEEVKQHIKKHFRKENEEEYLKMLSRKYIDSFVMGKKELKLAIKQQAKDFGIYQLFRNYFEEVYNDSGDRRFDQSFNKQFRNLMKEEYIQIVATQVIPKKDFFTNWDDFWRVTPKKFYEHSFNNLANYYGLVRDNFNEEDEILMKMRTFFGTLENNFI